MKTYQDLQEVEEKGNAQSIIDFVHSAIKEHKSSEMYKIAYDAEQYDRQNNTTIMSYVKVLYTITGKAVKDLYSPNHKIASNYFNRFTTQENMYLLGNGMHLEKDTNKKRLGNDFDKKLQTMGRNALVQGVSFGFWNWDKLETFKLTEFVPLWDEEDGGLKAGIRFFQIDSDKPLRATLYETDGFTNYIQRNGEEMKLLNDEGKEQYTHTIATTEADGDEIIDGKNYETFPIIPMYGNEHHQSELVGLRDSIDAYDLIKSGFSNDMDGAHIYWLLKNSGGMDDLDLTRFIERLNILGVAAADDETDITPHEVPIPYESRVAYLEKLEQDMYNDYQALNVTDLSATQKTATEIRAAYQPFDNKVDQYEYCVLDFLDGLFKIVGIEDTPTFTRNRIATQSDDMQTLLMAAPYLDPDYITDKSLAILGDPDSAQDVKDKRSEEDLERLASEEVNEEEVDG